MDSLIKRLQEAESGSLEFDALLACAVLGGHSPRPDGQYQPVGAQFWYVKARKYTTSLDAIVALIGEKLPGWKWSVGTSVGGTCFGCVEDDDQDAEDELGFDSWASTPALSLCIALLSALQSQEPTP